MSLSGKEANVEKATGGGSGCCSILAAGAAASRTQQKAGPKQLAKEQKLEKRVRGSREMADGQIKTVTSKGYTLDMTFDESYEILRLHTDNYLEMNFSAINFTPRGTMNPCKTAKGMYATSTTTTLKATRKKAN